MNVIRIAALSAACCVAGAAAAQDGRPPPVLQLPTSYGPAVASSAGSHPARPGIVDRQGNPVRPADMYHGDTSARVADADRLAAAPGCDDATYSDPQVHGSASVGVMGGKHASGSYEAATVNMTRRIGDCGHPAGAVGLSIHVSQGRFNSRRW